MRDYGPFWINHVWLDYSQTRHEPFTQFCHWFNIVEGIGWILLGLFVFTRYFKFRKSTDELWFAVAFMTFGLTDFYEAWLYPTWLIYVKAFNLIALLKLRSKVAPLYHTGKRSLLSL